jgi:hypothetical protein
MRDTTIYIISLAITLRIGGGEHSVLVVPNKIDDYTLDSLLVAVYDASALRDIMLQSQTLQCCTAICICAHTIAARQI